MSSSLRVAGTASLGCIGSWQPGHMTRGKVSAGSVLISRPISQGRSEHPIYGGFSTRQKCDLSATDVFAKQQRTILYRDLAKVLITAEPPNYSAGSGPTGFRLPAGGQPEVRRPEPIDEDQRLRAPGCQERGPVAPTGFVARPRRVTLRVRKPRSPERGGRSCPNPRGPNLGYTNSSHFSIGRRSQCHCS